MGSKSFSVSSLSLALVLSSSVYSSSYSDVLLLKFWKTSPLGSGSISSGNSF